MSNDTSTIAAGLLRELYKIPSYIEFKKLIEAGTFQQNPEILLNALFSGEAVAATPAALDDRYRAQLDMILKQVGEESVIYQYLALGEDFRVVKQKYLGYRALGVSSFYEELKKDTTVSLRMFSFYEDVVAKTEPLLHKIEDTFEFVSRIDSMYLQALARIAEGADEYIQDIVRVKIENYHYMTVLRLTQLGKSREIIESLFVPVEGLVSTYGVEHLTYQDVVTEVGLLVGLKPEQISVTAIETHLLNKEIATVNKATFTGVGGERIIQYFEQLRYFIADVKVVLTAHAMNLPAADVLSRLVAYDGK